MSELDELGYVRQVYQSQYALVNNSVQIVMREIQELDAAQLTLESVDLLKGKETLLGTGAGVYVRTVPGDVSSVLVAVGGGYVVERGVDDAKAFVSGQKAVKSDVLNRLAKNRREIEAALIDIEYKMDSSGLQV